jgi:hypothetical protein
MTAKTRVIIRPSFSMADFPGLHWVLMDRQGPARASLSALVRPHPVFSRSSDAGQKSSPVQIPRLGTLTFAANDLEQLHIAGISPNCTRRCTESCDGTGKMNSENSSQTGHTDSSQSSTKLFVGGLSWSTTRESLLAHYSGKTLIFTRSILVSPLLYLHQLMEWSWTRKSCQTRKQERPADSVLSQCHFLPSSTAFLQTART